MEIKVTPEIKELARADVKRLFTGADVIQVTNTDQARFHSAIGERCFMALHPEAQDVRKSGGSSEDFLLDGVLRDVKTVMYPYRANPDYYVFVEEGRIDFGFKGVFDFMVYEEPYDTCLYIGSMPAHEFLERATKFRKGDVVPPRGRVPLKGPRRGMTIHSITERANGQRY